ncbi:MAG: hypothetical protein WCF03_13585 [Nitrososphaeraceae archaeon]
MKVIQVKANPCGWSHSCSRYDSGGIDNSIITTTATFTTGLLYSLDL